MHQARDAVASQVVVGLALVAILAAGVHLRSVDPLSSPALAAEDPYSHVVYTKEALERGWFGPSVYLGSTMYPPGLHALAGSFAPLAGVTLYDFARFVPLVFGGLAILGMFALGARLGGPAAGLAAALITAVMPEHVFRTELFFPTALDLAILPAFLLFLWDAGTSDRPLAPALAFVAMDVALTFTHPWLVPLFAAPALAALMLTTLRTAEGPRDAARKLALPAALASAAAAFAMASRWTDSDTGFADFFAQLGPLGILSRLTLPTPVLFVALVVIVGLGAAVGVAIVSALVPLRSRTPVAIRVTLGAIVAVALFALVLRLAVHPPSEVSYAAMLGTVPIALALVGVGVALVFPTALGDLALVVSAALFPLTALNVFHSQFWPSRTVAYLCVGVALLGAASIAWAVAQALTYVKDMRVRRIAAPVAVLASIMLLTGAVVAHPAHDYKWYHLYTDEEFAGFQRVASVLAADPSARVITSTWQPALMVKTLALPSQDRYSEKFFVSQSERDKVLGEAHGAPRYLVIDKYVTKQAQKGGDLGIVNSGWKLVYSTSTGSLRLYEWVGG